MRVRMKIGPRSGEIVDLVYHAARRLVDAGQAEDSENHMRLPQAKITRIDEVMIEGRIPREAISAVAPDEHKNASVEQSKKKRK